MKHLALAVAFAVAIFPAGAFASCPDQNGPIGSFPHDYYTFTFGTGCASASGNVSATTLWCYSEPAYQWNAGSGSADYSMTVPSGMGGSNWSVSVFVEFSDPTHSSLNAVSATVFVWHNSSLSSYQTFYSHQGDQGSQSCERFNSNLFSVQDGDTIQVAMSGQSYNSGTTMQISTPIVFSNV